MRKIILAIMITVGLLGISSISQGKVALAAFVEQDDCAPNFVVNRTETACVPVNSENDPEGCYAAGGGADAIERCLASTSWPCELNSSILGLPTWYKYLNTETDSSGRCSPTIKDTNAALPIGIAILEAMLRLGGLVAVVMIFVAAFRYITSQGNPDNATAARKTAINALIGLVIVILATSLVSFLGNRLATPPPTTPSSNGVNGFKNV